MAQSATPVPPARPTEPRAAAVRLARLAPLSLLLPAAAAVWYVLAFNPTDTIPDPAGPCLWHMTFNMAGPTCGGTRMVWYLLHGDLVQAARHHLMALIAVPLVLYGYVWWVAKVTFRRRLPRWRPPAGLQIAYFAAFLLYAVVLRNLPWPPFDWFYVANLT
ncbi:MAG TPA: DUF2752 domain-containing protein [Micromonosporaceae bacterium]|nr:DUF2752 domain-containing protein [Micromonosporaceae bacterium]